jgi:hypothetical protein
MTVVDELLRTHPWYLASRRLPAVDRPSDLMHASPRTIEEHLARVREIWDSTLVPKISGRRVVLGLTLADQLLADWVVTSGVAAAVVESWNRDHAHQGGEGPPYGYLAPLGRKLVDALPLLRASLGGGPTWSTDLETDIAELAWSQDKSAILAVDAEGAAQLVNSAASRWAPRFPGPMIDIALPGNDPNKAVGAYLSPDGLPMIYNAPGATSLVVQLQSEAIESVTSLALSGDGRTIWIGGTQLQRGATTGQRLATVSDVGEGDILGASATGERCAVWSRTESELRVISCGEVAVESATTVSGTIEQGFRLEPPAAATAKSIDYP